jgi:hypothetical protein
MRETRPLLAVGIPMDLLAAGSVPGTMEGTKLENEPLKPVLPGAMLSC